jgi:hypothetical protein
MDRSSMTTAERAQAYLRQRRKRLSRLIQRPLSPPASSGDLDAEHRRFLREEAEELYLNELSWEQLTEEEGLADSGLVEFTFPGFLAFTEGLLLREVMPDSLAPARPRPEVVEDILEFLALRCVELSDAAGASDDGDGMPADPAGDETDAESAAMEREVIARLMDLVLYRQHGIDVEEVERLEEEEAPWRDPDA